MTRSLTLKELITPIENKFHDQNWESLGTRSQLQAKLSIVT
jgi:hypothetical protein